MTFGKNFLPGPTGIRPELLATLGAPMFAHYSPRMSDLLRRIQPHLQDMLGTSQSVFTVSSSGSGMIEGAVRSAVATRLLATMGGFFGEHFARIAERCGREVVRINVPPGKTVEADQLAMLLDGPPVDAVSVVHSETS